MDLGKSRLRVVIRLLEPAARLTRGGVLGAHFFWAPGGQALLLGHGQILVEGQQREQTNGANGGGPLAGGAGRPSLMTI